MSFGDWAEMQFIPATLGIAHPTGYPLYVLLGKLFSLLPAGSYAWRADLLSAVAAAGSAAMAALIAARLGVRPWLALCAGLALAVSGTLWLEATFSEMNSLHLLLAALVIHRALVWRDERRDRDLRLGALLSGLALANHALAMTVVPFVVVAVLVIAWRRVVERPVLVLQCVALFAIGPAMYLLIPLRALFGPASVYGSLLTWNGVSSLITGGQFQHDMHFGTAASFSAAWRAVPDVVAELQDRSNVVFVAIGVVGSVVLLARDRWAGSILAVLVVVNVYVYANYLGNLDHYLLLTWLVLAVWGAVALESLLQLLRRRLGDRIVGAELVAVLLPLAIVNANWVTHDQSGNRDGTHFANAVFGQLPPNAVLMTYWDALTNLSYEHCMEGVRPDVALRHFDPEAKVVCDPVEGTLEDVARTRPVYALYPFDHDLDGFRRSFDLVPGPRLALPYGQRAPTISGVLYRLVLKPGAS